MKTTDTVQYVTVELPEWACGRNLNELAFCREFLVRYPMCYVDGAFFNDQGQLSETKVRRMIFGYLSSFIEKGLPPKISSILEVLKLECGRDTLEEKNYLIHCANGTLDAMTLEFTPEKKICRCRLPVCYNPQAGVPRRWCAFLEELLEPGDILTLQEFLGYCLIPVNYAQKMLLIIGNGGEGKSRIGIVMQKLLGEGCCNGSLAKLESSPFARADLQHRLLMVDDDLCMKGLSTTSYLKSIITAEQPMDLERKGLQSYQGRLNCRLMAFGNGTLKALHDRSHGFYRRQIILTAKPRREDREDDPYLAQVFEKELEAILDWCICGLQRLLLNEMRFTITPKAEQTIARAAGENDPIPDFLSSGEYVRLDPDSQISARSLYHLYTDWCEDNMLVPLSARTVSSYLMQNGHRYGLTYTYNVPAGNGRHVRGFRGLKACSRY